MGRYHDSKGKPPVSVSGGYFLVVTSFRSRCIFGAFDSFLHWTMNNEMGNTETKEPRDFSGHRSCSILLIHLALYYDFRASIASHQNYTGKVWSSPTEVVTCAKCFLGGAQHLAKWILSLAGSSFSGTQSLFCKAPWTIYGLGNKNAVQCFWLLHIRCLLLPLFHPCPTVLRLGLEDPQISAAEQQLGRGKIYLTNLKQNSLGFHLPVRHLHKDLLCRQNPLRGKYETTLACTVYQAYIKWASLY